MLPFFLLTVASLVISSQAYEVVIVNLSQEMIIPRVQALDAGDAPDTDGFIPPNFERIYDNTNSWLNHPTMAVEEGDIRHMSILINGVEPVDCGDVVFLAGTGVTVHENLQCALNPLPLVTNSDSFSLRANIYRYAWVVDDFVINENTDRYYANGPREFYMKAYDPLKYSNVTFEAVEHSRHDLVDIKIETRRNNPCGNRPMNNAIGCEVQGRNRFDAAYKPDLNPNLPAGEYSGIAKIRGEQWKDAFESTFYLNIEITK